MHSIVRLNMKKHLFFDLDDTLIITNPVYEKVKEDTAKMLHSFIGETEISDKDILRKFSEIDLANAQKYGLSPKRYLLSWKETYQYFIKQFNLPYDEKEENSIQECAATVFSTKISTYPNVASVLESVRKQGHEMNILTAGVKSIQTKRLKDAEIEHFFDNVYVVPYKNPEVMRKIVGKRNIEKCVMIGNSLRSDIYPALSNNMITVHIPRKTWAYDEYDVCLDNPKYFKISDITELPELFVRI